MIINLCLNTLTEKWFKDNPFYLNCIKNYFYILKLLKKYDGYLYYIIFIT